MAVVAFRLPDFVIWKSFYKNEIFDTPVMAICVEIFKFMGTENL